MAEIQVIVFGLGEEQYGVGVQQVQSIERMQPITKVPRTLSFVRGVMNLRETVLPVLDLRERFGLAQGELTDETRIIVVEVAGVQTGLIVDSVLDVTLMDETQIDAPPAVVGGIRAEYLKGIARVENHALILLNLTKILSDSEEEQLREVEKSVHG